MVARVIPVDPFDLVIFGGTGDLARRKIIPALFRRHCAGQLENGARIIGAARTEMDTPLIAPLSGHRSMSSLMLVDVRRVRSKPFCKPFST